MRAFPLVLGTFAIDLLAQIIGRKCKCFRQQTCWLKQWVRLSCQYGSLRTYMASTTFFTHIRDCSVDTELSDGNDCVKTFSTVSQSAQKCIDNFPPPLLLSTPLDNGLVDRKTGCLLSANVNISCSSPWGLLSWVEYHFLSDPGPRNDHCPGENLFA